MTNQSPIVFILGSGPNIGKSVAQAFIRKGYKVANASRSPKEKNNTADQVNITMDLTVPDSIIAGFSKVKALLGLPSVVIYNASAATLDDPKNPFSIPLANFTRDMSINTTGPFVAAQQAVLGFEQLPKSASRTFIFTGNILNTTILPRFMDGGAGKSATAHIIQYASEAYKEQGFKFYYGDERKSDGSAAYHDIDGEAHADLYVSLAEAKSQGPWQQTFVKGVGYKRF